MDEKEMLNIINESYYGRTPEIKRIEECFNGIKMMKSKNCRNINTSGAMKEIAEIVKNYFNFDKVKIQVVNEPYINAFTYTHFVMNEFKGLEHYNDKKYLKVEDDGKSIKFKISKGKNLQICLTKGLIDNVDPEGITGILLHEIGHNFFTIKQQYKSIYLRYAVKGFLEAVVNTAAYLVTIFKYDNKKVDLFLKSTAFGYFVGMFSFFFGKTKKAFTSFLKTLIRTVGLTSALLSPVIMLAKTFNLLIDTLTTQSYNAEKYSDQFAASFGYGVEMVKALMDPNDYKNLVSKYSEYFKATIDGLYLSLFYFADPHPDTIVRLKKTKKKLEYELANNEIIDDDAKEEIKQQLDQIDKLLKNKSDASKFRDNFFIALGLNDLKDKIGSLGFSDEKLFDLHKTDKNN